MSEYSRSLYYFYKKNNVCVRCGQADAVRGKVSCPDCLEKNAKARRKILSNESPKEKEERLNKHKEYLNKRRNERITKGLCVYCAKPICSKSTVLCLEHFLEAKRKREEMVRKRNNGISRNERKYYGKCYVCNETLNNHESLCDKCYETACNNLSKKMNEKLYVIRKNQNKELFRN